MNQDWMKKIDADVAPSKEVEAMLDQALASKGSEQIRSMIQALPDEVPSMAWRSALNQKLATQAKPVKRRHAWGWLTGLSLAGAAALAMVLVIPKSPTPMPSQPSIEAALVAAHDETLSALELSSVDIGLPIEATTSGATDNEWNSLDLEPL